jgi:hypothetical protein
MLIKDRARREWLEVEESEQGDEVVQAILNWGSGETPTA